MKRNIAIIIHALRFGGAERCASNLSFDLAEQYDINLIVFDGKDKTYPYSGMLYDLNIPTVSGPFRKCLMTLKRIIQVKKIKKKKNIACSISLLTGANFVNAFSKSKDKTIVSIRNNLSFSRLSTIDSFLIRTACRKADFIVALSESVRQDMMKNYGVPPEKIETIYNSCNERLKDLAGVTDNRFCLHGDFIVTMGRIVFQKGQWHLIRAFSLVHKKYPDLKLVVLGNGEDELAKKVLALPEKLGIKDSVIFPGYITNPHQIISKSKMFVFPSLYEGLGNVLLEALVCGKAVISTDCMSGPREILAPGTDLSITEKRQLKGISEERYGVLIPAFDQVEDVDLVEVSENEKVLADAILDLYENDAKRLEYERRTRERIQDFSPQKISSQWIDLIERICHE